MPLIIADTFADSLENLTKQEQSAVKQTAFDLQVNPDNPGLSFHRIDKSKDKYFWSVRVNRDLRVIIHKRGDSVLLAYVDHHDDAYKWAEKRKLEIHPRTGAAQILVLRERVEEVVIQRVVEQTVAKSPLFADESDDTLLDCGVPEDWFDEVRKATDETLLDICRFLPAEASEGLLNLATGIRPERRMHDADADPFQHPDASRRFWPLNEGQDLREAIKASWEKVELTVGREQRDLVARYFERGRTNEEREADRADRDFSDPAKLVFRRKKRGPMGSL
ncbi:type II toxin-antitoxin system RelE family toxin [Aliiruegeria lutimaris]|uniref:DNA helicase n=1 Tax=Aliiruegeria lutimaris TaxID=571298 RepID=A0A1G8T1L9_9RHOB|nr:hypothetical protein [Aliiruegeria lutimaris]SDJ35373.1 hypothetical protein SAMN04488026_101618 [Aliiruegeria lutimaris]